MESKVRKRREVEHGKEMKEGKEGKLEVSDGGSLLLARVRRQLVGSDRYAAFLLPVLLVFLVPLFLVSFSSSF